MIYALIQNNTVVNTIIIDDLSHLPIGYQYSINITNNPYCSDGMSPIQIGCGYDGIHFISS